MNICATKIQSPSNIIQSRYEHAISMKFSQRLTDTATLEASVSPAYSNGWISTGFAGSKGTILPDLRQRHELVLA